MYFNGKNANVPYFEKKILFTRKIVIKVFESGQFLSIGRSKWVNILLHIDLGLENSISNIGMKKYHLSIRRVARGENAKESLPNNIKMYDHSIKCESCIQNAISMGCQTR